MIREVSFGLGVLVASAGFCAEPTRLREGPSTGSTANTESSSRVESPYWQSTGGTGDLPATDIRLVPIAKAAAVQARWTHLQLLTDLNNATRLRLLQLESDPGFRQARQEESAAYDAMQTARSNALAGLQKNDAYVAAQQLQSNMTHQIADMHADRRPDYDRINAAAQVKMGYVADNRKLENDALARDSAYQDARRVYIAAAQRVSDLRQSNATLIATDESLVAIRQRVADARIAKVTTAAYLGSAVRARDIALDYGAYYRSIDRYHPSYAGPYYPLGTYYPSGIRYVRY